MLKEILSLHSKVDYKDVTADVYHFLIENEKAEYCFKSAAGVLVFTNGRIFSVQEAVGKGKKEYSTICYKNISKFSLETAGIMDRDAELHIWHSGCDKPVKWGFDRKTNIVELSKFLFKRTLK